MFVFIFFICLYSSLSLRSVEGNDCGNCKNGTKCSIDTKKCIDVDKCLQLPCHKQGTSKCTNTIGSFKCECNKGWKGDKCDIEIDYCYPNPCENRGTCDTTSYAGDFQCNCEAEFAGKTCNQTNLCFNITCDPNKTSCFLDKNGKPRCECKRPGFTGINCDQDIDECVIDKPNICEPKGRCLNSNGSFSCNCSAGWEGERCDKRKLHCDPASCLHGLCIEKELSYLCICNPGYKGKKCDEVATICDTNPCVNGKCLLINNSTKAYECMCHTNWIGVNCSIAKTPNNQTNSCNSSPCNNGGICQSVGNSYTCLCQNDFTGQTCDYPINACLFNQCQNNGQCITLNTTSYFCKCKLGFNGKYCEKNIDDCAKIQCLNGGLCIDGINKTYCKCQPKWDGKLCERMKINSTVDCQSNCVNNGVCSDGVCICYKNYEGDYCKIRKKFCFNGACYNNGVCLEDQDSYKCRCSAGFYGPQCQWMEDQCSKCSSFGTAKCNNFPGGYNCKCNRGFTGSNCENNTNDCINIDCGEGTCIDMVNNYTCSCKRGYGGDDCSQPKKSCLSKPCVNGKCITSSDGLYTCQCNSNYTGFNCDYKVDECMDLPCEHGVCRNGQCICSAGFTGANCSTNINDCHVNACNGNGRCIDLVSSYQCQCTVGFRGDRCSFDSTVCQKCKNGASCVTTSSDELKCLCADSFSGDLCEIEENVCPYPECSTMFNGNGCDTKCNIHQCNWDGTDCSLGLSPWENCKASKCWEVFGNGICDQRCNNEDCMFDDFDCQPKKACKNNEFCLTAYNNSVCDVECNTKECAYDNLECEVEKMTKKVPGLLVMELLTNLQQFKKQKNDFERQLSVLLNSNVKVLDFKEVYLNSTARRKRRSTPRTVIQIRASMDNSKCTSRCFQNTEAAATFLAAKASKNQLNLPFKVYKVEAEGNTPENNNLPIWVLMAAIPLACIFIIIAVIAGMKRVHSKLWRPEGQTRTGARAGPDGQEGEEMMSLHQSSSESIGSARDIKQFKTNDMLGSLGSHEWFNTYNRDPADDYNAQEANIPNYKFLLEVKKRVQMNFEYVCRMIDAGVDINVRDDADGRTALHFSITFLTHEPLFKKLIDNRNCHIDIQSNDGCTPLMEACKLPETIYAEMLINNGAKVIMVDNKGQSALHHAAKHNLDSHCVLLLRANAKIDLQDNKGQSPLFLAARDNCQRAALVLRNHCANANCTDNMDVSPIAIARSNEHYEIVRMLSDTTGSPLAMSLSPSGQSPQYILHSPPTSNISPTYIRPKIDFHDNKPHPIPQQQYNGAKRPRKQTKTNNNKKRKNKFNDFEPSTKFLYPTPQQQQQQQQQQQNDQTIMQPYDPNTCLDSFPTDWAIPASNNFTTVGNEPSFMNNYETILYANFPTPPSVGVHSPPNFMNSPNYIIPPNSYLTPSPDWSPSSDPELI